MKKKDLEILDVVILSYNVCEQLESCLNSLFQDVDSEKWKIWVIDNASSDGSVAMVRSRFERVEIIESPVNVGFASGNNLVRSRVKTGNILFLNPDTIVPVGTITTILNKLIEDSTIGAITCKVELPDGRLDEGCHRGFPTPWNSLCHFGGLSKIFPRSRLFSGYQLGYLNLYTVHEIDSLTGAFMMLRKHVADQVGWWDEDYFWNGEDLDLCYRIKKAGYKIIFDPSVKIVHYKGSSAGYKKSSIGNRTVSYEVKIMAAKASTQAMRIFYKKHYEYTYPKLMFWFVTKGIDWLESSRIRQVNKDENSN